MSKYIDNLTKIHNFSYLENYYNDYIKNKNNCYLISIDLKKLKYINDNFGHEAGDKSIIAFANNLAKAFVDSLVVRRSGDEFVVITNFEYNLVLEKLKAVEEEIKGLFEKGLLPINFSFNCGIKECGLDLNDKSDITMYRAKKDNRLYQKYSSKFLTELQIQEDFIKNIDELIETNSFTYGGKKIYDVNNQDILLYQIYALDKNGKSIFADGKFEILKTNYRVKYIDIKNIENIIQNIILKLDENSKYMVYVYYETLFSRELEVMKMLRRTYQKDKSILKRIILNIDISEYEGSFSEIIYTIMELKEMGIGVGLNGLDFSCEDLVLPIVSILSIDYVNISRKTLVKGMNEKRCNIVLSHIIKMFILLNVTPIFCDIQNNYEVEYVKKLSEKCLIRYNKN